MAQALRTAWLQPDEQQEQVVLQPRARRQPKLAVASLAMPVLYVLAVAFVVAAVIIYIGSNARIAEHELRQQALQKELAHLQREQVRLNLALDRLSSQSRVTQVAQVNGLAYPTLAQIDYVASADNLPQGCVAEVEASQPSWAMQAGCRVVATFDTALRRLSPGSSNPVMAQD